MMNFISPSINYYLEIMNFAEFANLSIGNGEIKRVRFVKSN